MLQEVVQTQSIEIIADKWLSNLREANLACALMPSKEAAKAAASIILKAVDAIRSTSNDGEQAISEHASELARRLTGAHALSLDIPMDAFLQSCYCLEDAVFETLERSVKLRPHHRRTISRFFRYFAGAASKAWMEELQFQRDLVTQHAGELEAVIGHMADGVFMSDAEGLNGSLNPAGRQIMAALGNGNIVSLAETNATTTNSSGEIITREQHPLYRALFKGEIVRQEEMTVDTRTAGAHTLAVSASPVWNCSNELVGGVVIFRDITDLKQLEALKDDFLSIASHELRTPLTSVKAYTQLSRRKIDNLLAEQPVPDGPYHTMSRVSDHLRMVNVQADKLALMINELLDVSRIETGRFDLTLRLTDLSQLTKKSIESFASTIETNSIAFNPCCEGLQVNVDPERIQQVIVSLLSNAHRYSPKSEAIEIATFKTDAADRDTAYGVVSVADKGIGIAPEDLPHVFDRFYRSSTAMGNHYRGMGVGLYVSSEIAKRHNGDILVDSSLGGGSTFYLKLPLAVV